MLVWDSTCPDTLALSYLTMQRHRGPGLVAASAEDKKRSKYSFLEHNHISIPVAMRPLMHVVPRLPGRPWLPQEVPMLSSQYLCNSDPLPSKGGTHFGVHATGGIPAVVTCVATCVHV